MILKNGGCLDNSLWSIEIITLYNKKVVTRQEPKVSAVLPNGNRFEGIIFDII